MARIDLVEEVLRHSDEEIIEYMYRIMRAVYNDFRTVEDPALLYKLTGSIEQVYAVVKGLKERNDSINAQKGL